jgi:hypothetical protein
MSGERRRLQPIPYYYKEDELVRYQRDLQKKGLVYDIQPYLEAPMVNLELSQKFKREAEGLRDTIIRDEFIRLGFPANFTDHITIYTKYDFDQVLQRAIAWFKRQKQQPYIVMTEAILGNRSPKRFANDTKELKSYKSSEWVSKLFLHHPTASTVKPPVRLLDESHPITLGSAGYLNSLEADTFLLMDDGIYSGIQKQDTIDGFIRQRTKPYTLYFIPLYWTELGLHRIMKSIENYYLKEQSSSVLIVRNKTSYKITIGLLNPFRTSTVIYIWTGGEQMKTVYDIIEKNEALLAKLDNVSYDKKEGQFHYAQRPRNFGITLSLFEHKVPDNLSLVEAIGHFYKHRMNVHYRYNPPYKKIVKKTSPVI